jgi:hypothetical protein
MQRALPIEAKLLLVSRQIPTAMGGRWTMGTAQRARISTPDPAALAYS